MFMRRCKFKHVFGKPSKKEFCYEDIRITKNSWDSTFCSVNPKYIAIITEAAGGGTFLVHNIEKFGRVDRDASLVAGHRASVLDIEWCPHNDDLIASASEDCTVKVWQIPDGGLLPKTNLTEPIADLVLHQRRVGLVTWHPTAEHVLLSAGADNMVFIWNVPNEEALVKISFPDMIFSASFNCNGSKLVTTCKDRLTRIINPHTGDIIKEGVCHQGSKPQRAVYVKNDKIFTTGFSPMSERQYALWKDDDLESPLQTQDLDTSNGVLFIFYDRDTNLVYLCGKGDSTIRYFEIIEEEPYIYFIDNMTSSDPQRGMGWMPKRGLNVNQNEIARFYKLHTRGLCEVIAFTVPRKSELFQDDLYPDTASDVPAISADEWFAGKDADPVLMSLKDSFQSKEKPSKKLPSKTGVKGFANKLGNKTTPTGASASGQQSATNSTKSDQRSVVSKICAKLETNTIAENGSDLVTSTSSKSQKRGKEQNKDTKPISSSKVSSSVLKRNPGKKIIKKDRKSPVISKTISNLTAYECPLAVQTDDDIGTTTTSTSISRTCRNPSCFYGKCKVQAKSLSRSSTGSSTCSDRTTSQKRRNSFNSFELPEIAPKPGNGVDFVNFDKMVEAIRDQNLSAAKNYIQETLTPANNQIAQLTNTVTGLFDMLQKMTIRVNHLERQLILANGTQQTRHSVYQPDPMKKYVNGHQSGLPCLAKPNCSSGVGKNRDFLFSPPLNYGHLTVASNTATNGAHVEKSTSSSYGTNGLTLRQLSCGSKIDRLERETKSLKGIFMKPQSNHAQRSDGGTVLSDDTAQYMMITGGNFGTTAVSDVLIGQSESPKALNREMRMFSPLNCITASNRSLPAPLLRKSSSNRQLLRGFQSPEPMVSHTTNRSGVVVVSKASDSVCMNQQNAFSASFYSCKSPLPISAHLNCDSTLARPRPTSGRVNNVAKVLNCSERTTPVPGVKAGAGLLRSGGVGILSPQPFGSAVDAKANPLQTPNAQHCQLVPEDMGVGLAACCAVAGSFKNAGSNGRFAGKSSFRTTRDDKPQSSLSNNVLRYSTDTTESDHEWLD